MRVVRPIARREPPAEQDMVRVLAAPAYEILFMLAAAPHPRRYELARGWGAALQRRLSPQTRLTWRAFFGGEGAIGSETARLVARLNPPHSVDDFITLLLSLPPADFALAFLGDAAANPVVAELAGRVANGLQLTTVAERTLSLTFSGFKPRRRAQVRHVLEDVEGARHAYTSLLHEADMHILTPQWPVLGPLLESARLDYTRRYAPLSPHDVATALMGVPAALPEEFAGPLVVALSYHLYPFALLQHGPSGPLLVAGTRGQETASDPDPGTIRVLKALADATRLRILELVAERPRYVQELADVLDVRHPTVIHHLTLLRQAGLVEAREDQGTTSYVLQPAMLDAVVAHLRRRLLLGPLPGKP